MSYQNLHKQHDHSQLLQQLLQYNPLQRQQQQQHNPHLQHQNPIQQHPRNHFPRKMKQI